jgi:hypothetical protein
LAGVGAVTTYGDLRSGGALPYADAGQARIVIGSVLFDVVLAHDQAVAGARACCDGPPVESRVQAVLNC